MKTRLFLLIGIVTLLAVSTTASGCGGDATLTSEEYFQRLEALIDDGGERTDALVDQWYEDLASATSEEEKIGVTRAFYEGLVSLSRDYRDGLNDIDPPEELEGPHSELVDVNEDLLEGWEEIGDQLVPVESEAELSAQLDELYASDELVAARERADEACLQLQRIADDMGIDVDLQCGG